MASSMSSTKMAAVTPIIRSSGFTNTASAANLPPTAVTLNNAVTSIPQNASTASPVKMADIVVTDDGLGNNNLTVSGADAGSFQIIGTALVP